MLHRSDFCLTSTLIGSRQRERAGKGYERIDLPDRTSEGAFALSTSRRTVRPLARSEIDSFSGDFIAFDRAGRLVPKQACQTWLSKRGPVWACIGGQIRNCRRTPHETAA